MLNHGEIKQRCKMENELSLLYFGDLSQLFRVLAIHSVIHTEMHASVE